MKNLTLLLLAASFLFACKKSTSTEQTTVKYPALAMCAARGAEVDALMVENDTIPLFDGLGNLKFEVTSVSDSAKRYFIQGYQFANGFNHLEAARSFRYATKLDPECAMCYWGIAYVLGPNYNATMDTAAVALAYDAIQNAQKWAKKTTPVEQAIIEATAKRYSSKILEDRSALDNAYADALKAAHQKFPDDTNIAALYAESLMNLHPWDIWQKDGSAHPWTAEIIAVLEGILSKEPNNIVGNHMYIHATEASKEPQKAKGSAGKLAGLAPASGHLVHMSSHTYIRTGDYHLGSLANLEAIRVDSIYLANKHAGGPYPLAYFPHNYHFLAATAAMEGNSILALEASIRMARQIDTVMMRVPVLHTLQHYRYNPLFVMVKFNRWDDILNYPKPAPDLLYPICIWHYARGMAFLGKNDLANAGAELKTLDMMKNDPQLKGITIWDINNAADIVRIGASVLAGAIAAKNKNYDSAVQFFKQAVATEDSLKYNEPPDWFFSIRHELGSVLLDAQKYEEAQRVFEEDLKTFPNNGWALNGLAAALHRQGKKEEAKAIKKQRREAWKYADIKLAGAKLAM